jgi:SAM-dependent methyltransferase
LCGGKGRFALAEPDRYLGLNPGQKHPYFFCSDCRHFFQPVVPVEELLAYYPPAYYGHEEQTRMPGRLPLLRLARRANSVEWRAQKGRFLDVGCGRGALLGEMKRRGWEAVGMDWNADNAQIVSQRLGIAVVAGPEGLRDLKPRSFDAVALFHVLEHEQQPLRLLAQVHALVGRNGRVVIAVPNAGSLARRLFGRYWMGYDFPRHRQVFSRKSLAEALSRSGFQLDRMAGRLSDEMLDLYRSSALMLGTRGIRGRLAVASLTAVSAAIVMVPRLFGQSSVLYAYGHKR